MSAQNGSREFRDRIVGKTIEAVVARPGRGGQPPVVLLLRFTDNTVVEFVSPRSDRWLRESLTAGADQALGSAQAADGMQLRLYAAGEVQEAARVV